MKGQTITELLYTYGWAILIILIVAGTLAYYGLYLPSTAKISKYDYVTTLSTSPTMFCKFLDKETLSCDVKYCFLAGGLTTDNYCQDATNKSAIFRLVKQ
jgi:hypothetical protein